ncbi:nickel-dependent hydrogenase large subunit, partial [Candidatus Woesearchaeota archaeon]|nr:nickel-dependent hydrogenase large subunit [Candidatus Woesearchaeota archaeon]
MARICGTCSIAHTMCAIEAIEKALDVEVTKQTALMKKLIVNGLMIRDHALHMYMFSLPDVFRKDSVLDFNDKEKKFLYDAFAVKKAGNMLSTAIGGRAVHAPLPQIGGFSKVPDVKALKECTSQLKTA